MRILITNDDGIQAPELIPLVQWAMKLGEVVVAAPKYEQSAKSHAIEIHKPFEVTKADLIPGVTSYAVDSTPADCVRYMILGRKEHFDLVISGINRGLNMGGDIKYSGTVAAVIEAAYLGVKAIACSTDPSVYIGSAARMDSVYDFITTHHLLDHNMAYNINIPIEIKGFKITRQGGPYFSDDFLPLENNMYRPTGKCVYEEGLDFSYDTHATLHGYISVMPLTIDKTDYKVYEQLYRIT